MPRSIATNTRVDREGLLAFLQTRKNGVLFAHRASGAPQLSPVTYAVGPRGDILISTYPERAKAANLRRDSRCSLMSLGADFNDPWVQVDGVAEVIDPPDAVEGLVEYFRAAAGEHPDWAEYRQAMRDQGKSLIRIRIETWGPIATGGFPPRLVD
ncbi:PPOX class F420-dependent oxidoreductase [Tsukamurella sp. 8F]|uniref:PPOX class F420-dependent oxidoreductase n=1 Tax=unclassified Tsukamurella TaxID=2633480 RepID=UPI0023BA1DF2|nr:MULTISPECIES: PPOX class F420-dependent oxidoreductase [unclassified Tsukamurella]MDF0529295.1 PPOX class F420-dependent oxidoreductase [Tsukamurella sp. 8J]MDF0586868.1 PPOX class F420-dependent oxidoreductase [Tsukamurella sp. 8F]